MQEPRNILIVEDDGSSRLMLKTMLEDEGFNVIEAEDGEMGLKKIEAQSFDLIMTDLLMPNMDGYTLIKEIKELQLGTKIIAMSGGGEYSEADDCLNVANAYGMSAIIKKPINKEDLIKELDKVFKSGS